MNTLYIFIAFIDLLGQIAEWHKKYIVLKKKSSIFNKKTLF